MSNVKINRDYDVKWQKDFDLFLPIYNCFALEGYINDLYPVKQGACDLDPNDYKDIELPVGMKDRSKYAYLNLAYTIAEKYKDKYCVVFFDHTKKEGREGRLVPKKGKGREVAGETEVEHGTFEIYDAQNNEANVALFDQLYENEYKDEMQEEWKRLSPLSRDMMRIRDAMTRCEENLVAQKAFVQNREDQGERKEYKPFLFILKRVSRFMVMPGRTSPEEFLAFNVLFELSQMSQVESKLVLFVDRMSDLPTWFESENSNYKIKKLYVSNPDSDFKTKYFLNELCSCFEPNYSILKLDRRNLQAEAQEKWDENRNTFDDDLRRFNAYTEGFTTQTLQLFKAFVKSTCDKPAKLKSIDSLVQRFRLGNQTNLWESEELKRKVKDEGDAGLLTKMKSNIVGQDPVIEQVHKKLTQAVTGLDRIKDNDRRPRAVFFFVGPTGTGKTELTKLLARELFGSEDRMIRFDMSEFRAAHTESRLFGAPPGYVGYESGGELTQAVKQNPFSIILFDEIEKANENILDKFLQILGDGRLTDGKGETVYFSDSIIIFTSNCGMKNVKASKMLEEAFWSGDVFKDQQFYEHISKEVKGAVEKYFEGMNKPELLGRIGSNNILAYNYMTPTTGPQVAQNTIKRYCSTLEKKFAIKVSIDDAVVAHIKAKILELECDNKNENEKEEVTYKVLKLGARAIVDTTENLLKEAIDDEKLTEGSTITFIMNEAGDTIVCN